MRKGSEPIPVQPPSSGMQDEKKMKKVKHQARPFPVNCEKE